MATRWCSQIALRLKCPWKDWKCRNIEKPLLYQLHKFFSVRDGPVKGDSYCIIKLVVEEWWRPEDFRVILACFGGTKFSYFEVYLVMKFMIMNSSWEIMERVILSTMVLIVGFPIWWAFSKLSHFHWRHNGFYAEETWGHAVWILISNIKKSQTIILIHILLCIQPQSKTSLNLMSLSWIIA